MRERTEYVSIIGLYRDYFALLPTNPLVSLSNGSGLVTQGIMNNGSGLVTQGIMKHTNLSKVRGPLFGHPSRRIVACKVYVGAPVSYGNVAPE